MSSIREIWLDYYQQHYLNSVATLFAKNEDIFLDFIENIFKESKYVDNQRERKKILKTIYHNYDINHPFFDNSYRILTMLRKNSIDSSTLSYYLNTKNFESYSDLIDTIDTFNLKSEFNSKIPKSYSNLLETTKKMNMSLNYPTFFDDIKNCIEGFNLEPVKNYKKASELSIKYHNCWMATMPNLIKRYGFFLINLKDKEDQLIGTLRYLKNNGKYKLSGWINPEIVEGNKKYYEFSIKLLNDISTNIYQSSKNEDFNPKNMIIDLHYNNHDKTINELSHWKKSIEKNNSIGDTLKNKENELFNNKKRKIKFGNLFR